MSFLYNRLYFVDLLALSQRCHDDQSILFPPRLAFLTDSERMRKVAV